MHVVHWKTVIVCLTAPNYRSQDIYYTNNVYADAYMCDCVGRLVAFIKSWHNLHLMIFDITENLFYVYVVHAQFVEIFMATINSESSLFAYKIISRQ